MTLIVALRGKDGMVIAADSRGTIGDPRALTAINDDQVKLFKLSKYCGIGITGASEFAAKIIDDLNKRISIQSLEHADEIMEETRKLLRAEYDNWFGKFQLPARPSLALTLAGYGKDGDGTLVPRTYLLSNHTDFAPNLFPNGNCLSGVPQYAVYLMHRFYDAKMKVGDLCRLAAYLISETATQDPKVGGPIRIATLSETSGYSELPEAAVNKIVARNTEQNQKLKKSFLSDKPKGRRHGN